MSSANGGADSAQKLNPFDQAAAASGVNQFERFPSSNNKPSSTRSAQNLHLRNSATVRHSARSIRNGQPVVLRQAESLDENRIVLYKRSKQLGQGYFIVEISSGNDHLYIAAFDVESPESLLIELPEKRAQEILNEFANDYDRLAGSL